MSFHRLRRVIRWIGMVLAVAGPGAGAVSCATAPAPALKDSAEVQALGA